MGKLDPQKRSLESVERMVRSRQRHQARLEADDWLARGWNPFALQDSKERRSVSGFALMAEFGGWGAWLEKHKEKLGELASAALKKGPSGKLQGQRGALARLSVPSAQTSELKMALDWGLDPNEASSRAYGASILFEAGRGSAELLLAAGADPLALDANGRGIWERWAQRACSPGLSVEDVKWMEQRAPAPDLEKAAKRPDYELGVVVFSYRSPEVARLMLERGAGEKAFNAASDAGLQKRLWEATMWSDSPELTRCLAEACGWERVVKASVSEMDHAPSRVKESVAAALVRAGHARCLGALEEHGLLKLTSAAELARGALKAWEGGVEIKDARGLAWLFSRFDNNQRQEALELWKACVGLGESQSALIAERLATRNWLPASGPFSLSEVYDDGRLWESDTKSFSEFSALCERKALKKTIDKKTPVKKASARL